MKRRLLPVALSLLLAGGAHAQDASSIPPPRDAVFDDLARELREEDRRSLDVGCHVLGSSLTLDVRIDEIFEAFLPS